MPDKPFDVLVAGELNVDLILNRLDQFPAVGKEILARDMLLTLGSSSAIFASNLAALGSRVRFCGRVGRDAFGDKVLADLKAANVDCSAIARSPTAATGVTVALNVNEDRAMVTYPGAMEELMARDITDEMLDSARHLHVSSIFLQPALKPGLASLFRRARLHGLTTSLDPQWDPAEEWHCDLNHLLPCLNVFLPNEQELKYMAGTDSWESALEKIKELASTIVIKRGNAGATMFSGNQRFNQHSFLNDEVADAIGAGDSFNAGFIHRFVNGFAPEACLGYGALCGALNTTSHGGTTAFKDMAKARQLASEKFNQTL